MQNAKETIPAFCIHHSPFILPHWERLVRTPARPRLVFRRLTTLLLSAVAAFLAAAAPAAAQVDVDILREPWEPVDQWAETGDKPIWIATGRIEGTDDNVRIFHWDSVGRVKFDRDERAPENWLGYRLLALSVDSDLPAIDHSYYDISVTGAAQLGAMGGGWTFGMAAGFGTANDGSFRNADALYPIAMATVTKSGAGEPRWDLGIGCYGNSSLLPALPIPVIQCELEPDPALRLRLGIPRTEAVAHLDGGPSATLRWDYPTNALARLEQELGSGWSLFAEGSRRVDGFHMRESGSTRMFYELNAAEAGIRWVTSWADISLSTGYALEQSFFTGYDMRNRDEVGSPENRPFVALTVQGTF
jgi:hypothetical protein